MIIDSPIISGSYAASGSLNQLGNVVITGSLTVTGPITGNITGSANSASYALTASYAANVPVTASYANNATSASYAVASTSASYAATATSASFSATASYLSNYIPPFPFTGSAGISGSLTVNGNITAQTLIVQTITSSVDFVTGSTRFGSIIDNTHQFTGSVSVSGSLVVGGPSSATLFMNPQTLEDNVVIPSGYNALVLGPVDMSSSIEVGSGSNLIILENFTNLATTGSNNFTGSQTITGSLSVTQGITGSLLGTAATASYVAIAQTASFVANAQSASYILNAVSASYATSASNASAATSASYALTASYASNVPETSSYAISASNAITASFAPLYLPLAGGNMTGDIYAAGRAFTFQDLLLGAGTTFGKITTDGSKYISIMPTYNVESARFWGNGNVTIQDAGTYVDNGFRLDVSGSGRFTNGLTVTGSINVSGSITGSLLGTASYADNAASASYALTSSYSLSGGGFPYSGSAQITGSLLISNLEGTGARYLVTDASGNITAQTASAAIRSTQTVVATAGQTTFNITNGYTTGLVDVFVNGTKLNSSEFTDTNGTTIILATGSFVNDVVEFEKYFPASGVTNNALRQQTTFTASAGQTVFSASYTPGLIDIFYNGSRLSNSDYTANNGTFFTLATASAADDILDVFVYSYQVGAFSGIGGAGAANQFAYFNTSSSITSSNVITISGGNAIVTGSLLGTASFATSASNATTASYVLTAQTASYVLNAQSASYVLNAQTSSYVLNAISSSFATRAITASYADSLTVAGTLTAQTLVVQTITSSVDFVTGSTRFGSLLDNTHVFSGSVTMNPGGLFVSSSGRVGIGTTSPNEVFEVFNPEVAGTSQQTRIRIAQAASVSSRVNLVSGVISGSNPYFAIEARQSASPFSIVERLRIDGSGNVGIGTTSPLGSSTEKTLHLSDDGVGYTTLYVTNGANTLRGIFAIGNAASTISIGTQTNHDLRIVTNDSVKMTITNGGSVGIGITNPSRMLQVKSNSEGQTAGISGATYGIRFDNGGTNSPNMSTIHGVDASLIGSYQPIMLNGLDVRFGTSDTERMRITSAGNVGINESSPSSMLHFSKQTTWGTTDNRIININNSGTGGNINVAHNMGSITWYSGNSTPTAEIAAYRNTPASGNNIELRFYTATAGTPIESMRISSAGTVTKPYQPAFRAGRSTSYTPGAGTIIAFNSTSGFGFNVGGHYSASTGRFTAPVTGIYNFTACIIWESVPDGQQMDDAFEIRVNGSTAAYSFNRAEYVAGTTGNGGYYVDNATVLLNLTAGQYVEVYNRFNLTIHGNQNYCYFTGYLVG